MPVHSVLCAHKAHNAWNRTGARASGAVPGLRQCWWKDSALTTVFIEETEARHSPHREHQEELHLKHGRVSIVVW